MENNQNDSVLSSAAKLRKTDRLHRKAVESQVASLGIHRSQHMMLLYLSCVGNLASQREIAEHFEISAAAVAVTLKKLEINKYIIRKSDETDTRINRITLTPKGEKMIKHTRELFNEIDRDMFEGITESELEVFDRVLERLAENLKKRNGQAEEDSNEQMD